MLDAGFCFGEVLAEEFPGSVEHLVETDVDVDRKDSCGVVLRVGKTAVVVVRKVETVLKLGLCVLGISVETDRGVHHL